MKQLKVCPFMRGNYCNEERCALWTPYGRNCAFVQIGSSLAAINSSGLTVECVQNANVSATVMRDLADIAQYIRQNRS